MKGKCYYCKNEIGKIGVVKHIKSCTKREEYQNRLKEEGEEKRNLFILQISYKYNPKDYWMYISVDENATLEDLDTFLRDVWVECCGHLSFFRISGKEYHTDLEFIDEFGFEDKECNSMDVELKKILKVGLNFNYEYDFGDTTEITLKVVEKYIGYQYEYIEIVSRNLPKEYKCTECGNQALFICTDCGNYYCEECIKNRKCNCDEYMIYEITKGQNSPRCGCCGYVYDEQGEFDYIPDVDE